MDFSGKTVWLVGASSGIGEALARALHEKGAHLILSARSEAPLVALRAELGDHHRVLCVDVADRESLSHAEASLGPGSLDAMITTAAIYDPGRVADIGLEAAEQLLIVNVMGTLAFAKAAPRLLRKGGMLGIFGSVAGYFGLPKGQFYSASKAAVINLAQTLRVEYAPQIDVRLISPGFVNTRLTQKNDFDMPFIIEPDEAASAILHGLQSNRFEVHFPKKLTYGLKVLQMLPYWASLRLTKRMD